MLAWRRSPSPSVEPANLYFRIRHPRPDIPCASRLNPQKVRAVEGYGGCAVSLRLPARLWCGRLASSGALMARAGLRRQLAEQQPVLIREAAPMPDAVPRGDHPDGNIL